MSLLSKLTSLAATLLLCSTAAAGENLFYVLHSGNSPAQRQELKNTLSLIEKHRNAVNIIVTQAYSINEKGKVSGYLNPEMVSVSKANNVKVMAMITNVNFDQHQAHVFLSSNSAQQNALAFILDVCKKYQLHGVQFDFEMISIKDKNALTQFFNKASQLLHRHGFAVSFAVVPALSDKPGPSGFLKKTHENWSGAYDLKALGRMSDFITIMAYNQHPEGTTPGPSASVSWVEKSLNYTLQYVPAHKISLGIPAYSLHWYTGGVKRISSHRNEISFSDASRIIDRNHASVMWHAKDEVNFSVYERNWLNEYVYLEDVYSFQSKLHLANKYQLRGVSVFRIGTEDMKIWALLDKSPTLRYSEHA